MPQARRRTLPLVVTSSLFMTSLLGGPLAAAGDPEAAIEALFEAVSKRELSDLDGIACEPQREALEAAFSDRALGLDLLTESFDGMSVSVDDVEVEVLEADEVRAEAEVSATIVIDVDEEQLRELVRELLEAGVAPADPAITDADVDAARPLMADVLGLEQPIDERVTLVAEDGEWVVCGGFGSGFSSPGDQYETDPIVSDDGLCALATPAELSELSSLEYDSSTGLNEFCTYSQSDWDVYHAATLGLLAETTLDDWREVNAPDRELEIGGAPAFSSGANVFTQAGGDVLQVTVSLPDEVPEDVDVATQAAAISELFLPRLGRLASVDRSPEPTPARPSLCDAVPLRELEDAAGQAFDDAQGGPDDCTWSSLDPAAALEMVVATVTDLTLDEFQEVLDVADEAEVEGMPAIRTSNRAVVELPDGRTLDVSVYSAGSVEPSLATDLLALTVAGWLAPEIDPATANASRGDGLLAGGDAVDDICRALPFEELSAISGVTFEDPIFGAEVCEYYGGGDEAGWHYAATSLDRLPLSAWLEDDPDMALLEIAGQPAAVAVNPFGDGDGSALAVVEVPGFDGLTFSAYIAFDAGTDVEADARAVAEIMAELGLARLQGDAD